MTNLESLKTRIREEAREEAEGIIEEAAERERKIISEAEERAEARKREIIERAEEEAEQRKRRAETLVRLERRNRILEAKQEEIEAVFHTVLERIGDLERQHYLQILENMLIEEVDSGREQVILSPEDREEIGEELLDRVNGRLKKLGRDGSLSLAGETRPMSAGFILKEDGVENNNSFEELMATSRDELEGEVARILFDRK